MSQQPEVTPQHLKRFTAILLAGSTLMAVVIALVIPGSTGDENQWWVAVVLFAGILAMTALAARRWSRAEPLTFDDPDPTRTSLTRLMSHLGGTFPLLEVPLIATIAVGFLGLLTFEVTLVALVMSAAALVFGMWPTRDHIDQFATALEASGVPSGLREAFGR